MVNKGFKVPREAEDVKNLMLSMWVEVGRVRLGDSITDPESQDVWRSPDMLQEYLWESWKEELNKKGFTHQKFNRLMRYRTDDLVLWVFDRISWAELIDKIIDTLDGNIGKAILEGADEDQRLSLEDVREKGDM